MGLRYWRLETCQCQRARCCIRPFVGRRWAEARRMDGTLGISRPTRSTSNSGRLPTASTTIHTSPQCNTRRKRIGSSYAQWARSHRSHKGPQGPDSHKRCARQWCESSWTQWLWNGYCNRHPNPVGRSSATHQILVSKQTS